MNEEHKIFNQILLQGHQLKDCEIAWPKVPSPNDDQRMYLVRDNREGAGFYCHAVEFVSCDGLMNIDQWVDECNLVVASVFEATAYFDGVRHLHFNRNGGPMDGYLYYPDMVNLSQMMLRLRELEVELCHSYS